MSKIKSIEVTYNESERVSELKINDVCVGYANYDEGGWFGIQNIEDIGVSIASLFDIKMKETHI